MPELPEVETVRRGLAPVMEGATIERVELRRPDLRFPFASDFSARLEGKRIGSVSRRAKYLLLDAGDDRLVSHLGMSGSFRIEASRNEVNTAPETPGAFHHERSKDEKHDHVVMHLLRDGVRNRIVYNDPRRFGFMLFADDPRAVGMLARLGVEPVGNAFGAQVLGELLKGKAAPLKAALLDQHLVAGLGNIYVSEALWRAGISPKRVAGSIVRSRNGPGERVERLAEAIRAVIAEAIEAGGSTLRDHRQTDGTLGYFQHRFKVYDRAGVPCPRAGCDGHIESIVQSGRSTFYCSRCQR